MDEHNLIQHGTQAEDWSTCVVSDKWVECLKVKAPENSAHHYIWCVLDFKIILKDYSQYKISPGSTLNSRLSINHTNMASRPQIQSLAAQLLTLVQVQKEF